MRTVTTQTAIYPFDELSEEVQEEVLNTNRDWEVDHDWWDFLLEDWKDRLNEIGFEDANIYFSHMYCQGDGAVFESDLDIEKLCSHLLYCDATTYNEGRVLRTTVMAAWTGLLDDFYLKRLHSLYDHGGSAAIVWSTNCQQVDDVMELIEALRYDLCQQIFFDLRREYEYLTSDEVVRERMLDLEFTKDGSIWN